MRQILNPAAPFPWRIVQQGRGGKGMKKVGLVLMLLAVALAVLAGYELQSRYRGIKQLEQYNRSLELQREERKRADERNHQLDQESKAWRNNYMGTQEPLDHNVNITINRRWRD